MKLQKSPLALLGAFALKVTGQNPPLFGDSVVPTIDIYDQYLATNELQRVGQTINIGVGVTSVSANQTVPAGKCWRVLAIGAAFSINAADAGLAFASVFSVVSPGGATVTQLAAANAIGSGVARSVGFMCPRVLFLPSGWSIQFTHTASGAGPTVLAPVASGVLVQEIDL